MKRIVLWAAFLLLATPLLAAQTQEVKYVADTVVVQAEGLYEADPDLATLTFHISVEDKELRKAYDHATESLQRILSLAERNGLSKQDATAGRFTVFPVDWQDRKRKARAYRVQVPVILRVRDFARIGPLLDESVEEGIVEFRSLTYSLADEETAKQRAIAEAGKHAEARARAALGDNGRKLGALRYLSIDVRQPVGIVRLEAGTIGALAESIATTESRVMRTYVAPIPPPSPEKIRVTATVQCVFHLV